MVYNPIKKQVATAPNTCQHLILIQFMLQPMIRLACSNHFVLMELHDIFFTYSRLFDAFLSRAKEVNPRRTALCGGGQSQMQRWKPGASCVVDKLSLDLPCFVIHIWKDKRSGMALLCRDQRAKREKITSTVAPTVFRQTKNACSIRRNQHVRQRSA